MNNKHMQLNDRIIIQEYLDNGLSIHKIAQKLNKSDSTIAREIQRNRYRVTERNRLYMCVHRDHCELLHGCGDEECNRHCVRCFRICNQDICPEYKARECSNHRKAPYVCNSCNQLGSFACKLPKYKYNAQKAQFDYENTLKTSRQGVSLTPEEMKEIDNIVSPLLLNGQSLRSIYLTHKDELPCSERTLYNYVDGCYLTARNIDMPRKIRFKTRYKHGDNKRNHDPFTFERTFDDFKHYLHENPDVSIVEMDTVIGAIGGKVLLTLMFRNSHLMMAILIPDKTQEAVITALNRISDAIGIETFRNIFGVILTDRGTEFSNPFALECDENGEIKTRVYYCDPYCSWQKGMIERNHEFIRQILPKGSSFDHLSQQDINLMMIHINNYPRTNLNGATPFALAQLLNGSEILKYFKYHKILPDNVILKPKLLRKPKNNK